MEAEGFARLFHNFENVPEPKECVKAGTVPSYLKGTMIRNGPGMFNVGVDSYQHWFDGLGFMQRYHFENGKMFYSARYLESEAFQKNTEANRIVVGSFGTATFQDPCKTIFSKYFSTFMQSADKEKHDNANVAFTPVGDGIYACTETPYMYRVDLETLETKEPVDFSKFVALHTCTAHQLYDDNGDVYNIGSRFGPDAAHVFTVTKNPKNLPSESDQSWEHTEKIGEIKCSNPLFPTYIHSFGMSENYLIMFESPVRIDIQRFMLRHFTRSTYQEALLWDGSKDVKVFVMNKKTGEKLPLTLNVAPFFTFHHANTFEKDGCLVVDYCRMENAGNFNAVSMDNMRSGNFQKKPEMLPFLTRLVIPLSVPESAKTGENLLKNLEWAEGLSAVLEEDGSIKLTDKRLCEISMEFPRYHWEKINMKEYQYVYGTTVFGMQREHMAGVIKSNVETGKYLIWNRENEHQVCGEPIFVPNPAGNAEDDGVLIVPIMSTSEKQPPFVLVLDANNLQETARFTIPEERIPLGFHAFYKSGGLN